MLEVLQNRLALLSAAKEQQIAQLNSTIGREEEVKELIKQLQNEAVKEENHDESPVIEA